MRFYVRVLSAAGGVAAQEVCDADHVQDLARYEIATRALPGDTIEAWPLDGEPYTAQVIVSMFGRGQLEVR